MSRNLYINQNCPEILTLTKKIINYPEILILTKKLQTFPKSLHEPKLSRNSYINQNCPKTSYYFSSIKNSFISFFPSFDIDQSHTLVGCHTTGRNFSSIIFLHALLCLSLLYQPISVTWLIVSGLQWLNSFKFACWKLFASKYIICFHSCFGS